MSKDFAKLVAVRLPSCFYYCFRILKILALMVVIVVIFVGSAINQWITRNFFTSTTIKDFLIASRRILHNKVEFTEDSFILYLNKILQVDTNKNRKASISKNKYKVYGLVMKFQILNNSR